MNPLGAQGGTFHMDLLVYSKLIDGGQGFLEHFFNITILEIELQTTRLDLGDVQNIVNQLQEMPAVLTDVAGETTLLVVELAGCAFRQQIREPDNGGQGRP